jgi:uncharacterized membrane protein
MKSIGRVVIIVGIIVVIMGVIFSLQSKSVVGPASSFMYDNPEWAINGSIIIAIGIVITALGSFFFLVIKGKK